MTIHGYQLVMVWLYICTSPSWANIYDWIPAPTACANQDAAPPTSGSPPTMPEWPHGYSLYMEGNMKNGHWSYEAEDHFDSTTKMASVSVTLSGHTQQTIFNSDPLERYMMTNEDTCITKAGDRDFHPLVFASMTKKSADPSKISTRHLLDFGSKSDGGFIYKKQTKVRGIEVNHWTSCQEWKTTSSNIQMDVYFSIPGHESAWGLDEFLVTIELKGTTGKNLLTSAHIPNDFEFENVYDYLSIEAGPSFKPEEDLFYIPMNVVCVGGSNNKEMPELPDSFEMDVELSVPQLGNSVPLVTSLRYDWENLVLESVREFSFPMGLTGDEARHKSKSHFEDTEKNKQAETEWITVRTLSTVEDFHTGIQYITERLSVPQLGNSVPLVTSLRYDWENLVLESVREFSFPMGLTGDEARHKSKSHFEDTEKNKQAETEWITVRTLSTVEDFHTGIQYITERNNNSCIVRHLPSSLSMSHGNTLLRMYKDQKQGLSQFTYQGRSILRGSPVESWGMDQDGMVQKVFFLSRSKGVTDAYVDTSSMTEEERNTFETGMSKLQLNKLNKYPVIVGMVVRNRTAVDNKNFPMLIKDLLAEGLYVWYDDKLKMRSDSDPEKLVTEDLVYKHYSWTRVQEMQTEHIGEMDVFVQHFQPLHIDGDLFRVSQCYKSEDIAKVILTVKASFTENVLHNPTFFLNPLRSRIAKSIGVSIIQISDIQATPLVNRKKDIDVTLVTFNLLGAAPIEESKNQQQDLETSKKRLFTAVKNGITFDVRYVHDGKSFSLDKEHFAIDYSFDDLSIVEEANGDNGGHDDKDTFSGGVVAGIAIAVAIATCFITLTIAFVSTRRHRPDSSQSIPYFLAEENSPC